MPIKVLHIIGSLGCGGAQVALKHIVENISSKEVSAFVYPLRSKKVLMPINGIIIRRPYPNYDPRKFFAILKLCRKYNIDILVGHLSKPIMGCLLASFFCKARVVVHEHGPVFRKGLQYSLYRFVLRLLWRRAAVFVAVSRDTADFLVSRIGITPDRIKVIPNAVDFNVFNPHRIPGQPTRKKLGISDRDIVLGFVGRLDHIKGVDLLIKAAALLLQRSQRYFLLLVGEGPERKALEKLSHQLGIEARVRFLGFCDNIPDVMTAFDIALVPSRQEPFGIVCLELMRMKIPVISSGVGGMAEYITNEETGLLLKENSPDEICRYVERLVNDEQLRQRLINGGYKLAGQFGANKYVKTFQRMYEVILHEQD